MKLGFLVHRNLYYKYFAPLIDEALKRGHQVFCFHDYSQPRKGKKGYQFPHLKQVPSFLFGRVKYSAFCGISELLRGIKEKGVQVLVSLHFSGQHIDLRNYLKEAGVYWVALQHSFDTVALAKYIGLPDRYLIYSDIWLDWMLDFETKQGLLENGQAGREKKTIKATVKAIGFPELDQKWLINPAEVRTQWGIPQGRPVVLFLPFPFGSTTQNIWSPFIYGRHLSLRSFPRLFKYSRGLRYRHILQLFKGQSDQNLVKALKTFCQNNNAYLLVKSREKDPVPPYLAAVADRVLYDDKLYPATIIKCLAVADLCVHFYSSAVTEAVPLGVPSLCIAPSVSDWTGIQGELWKMLLEKARGVFNFPGAAYFLTIPQAIEALPKKILEDFALNPESQKQYIEKFVGAQAPPYSAKALDEIENLVNPHKIS